MDLAGGSHNLDNELLGIIGISNEELTDIVLDSSSEVACFWKEL